MLPKHAVYLSCHVLSDVDFAFLVARDNKGVHRVQREAQNLFLMVWLAIALTVRVNLGHERLGER